MDKGKKKVLQTIIFMVVVAGIILAIYFKLSTATKDTDGKALATEADKLIAKDISNSYPGTPREVLKLYCRIIKCFYNDGLNEDKVEKLADQLRILFDDELLENNPRQSYIKNLKADIKDYRERDKIITSYTVQNSSSVRYSTVEKQEYATIIAEILVKEKSKYTKIYEEFILRKDNNNKWRILGWKVTSSGEEGEED